MNTANNINCQYNKRYRKFNVLNKQDNIYYIKNPIYFDELHSLVELHPTCYFRIIPAKNKKYSYLVSYINECIPSIIANYSLTYKIAWILRGFIDFPQCKTCNKQLIHPKYLFNVFDGFRTHCSNRCAQLDSITQKTISDTLYKHYGMRVKSCLQIPVIQQKSIATCIKKYNVKNAGGAAIVQQRCKKHYIYDGKNFHSSPELAYYIWLIDHNIPFQYHIGSLPYMYNGILHHYYPDFIVNGRFVEIKGDQFFDKNGKMKPPKYSEYKNINTYKNACGQYEAKYQCMLKNNVLILRNKQYQQFIDYVNNKYGIDYLRSFKKK